ncbi:cytochrome P450 [Mycena latifolia]|nr:cytochrome P450 [Mycena latifolia]
MESTRTFLQGLLRSPDNFPSHIRQLSGQIILSAAYGIEVSGVDDPYIDISRRGSEAVLSATLPSSFPALQAFPFLKHLPAWFPGAEFKRKGKEWGAVLAEARTRPLDHLKDSVAVGMARPSIGSRLISTMEEAKTSHDPYAQQVLQDTLSIMYPGSDTTMAPIHNFFLAMLTQPELQREAQKAVDAVVGSTRLPNFSDNIPYVDAIVRELLRWRPVTAIFAHASTTEDVYRGYRIPAGSTILFNQWAMLQNAAVYGPDVDKFQPARWLKDGELDPTVPSIDPAFGFGRRSCAGKEMALKTIWLAVASILATFDIGDKLDASGAPIVPSHETIATGFFIGPKDFQCSITPRSKDAELLVDSGYVDSTC